MLSYRMGICRLNLVLFSKDFLQKRANWGDHESMLSYRVGNTHRMPYLLGHFAQKSLIISGSFAQRDLRLKASLHLRHCIYAFVVSAGAAMVRSVSRRCLRCCSVLQCVAVCCSVLQRVSVCCSVLQCVAVQCVAVCCSALQCVAVHCVAACVAVCCRVLQGVAVQCVAVCVAVCRIAVCCFVCCSVL